MTAVKTEIGANEAAHDAPFTPTAAVPKSTVQEAIDYVAAQVAALQPLDGDLTTWALITRAAGFDTFTTTPSSANLASLVTNETGTGALVFANSPALVTPTISDGTVSAPGISFTSDTNTGFLRPATDTLAAATAGVERWRLSSTGVVTQSLNSAALPAPPSATTLHVGGPDGAVNRVVIDSFGASANLTMRVANGTAASPTALTNGSLFFNLVGFGYGATGYSSSARVGIQAYAAENWTDTAQGSGWLFLTSLNGTAAQVEKMRITDAGNVGIGASPGHRLDVWDSKNGEATIRLANATNGTAAACTQQFIASTDDFAFGIRAPAHSAGRLAYLYNASGVDLAFFLSNAERMRLSAAGALRLNTYGVGTLTSDASGNITAVSDERLKDDIAPWSNGLSEIEQINPISYKWSVASGMDRLNTYYGFSAQNVEAAIPEAVGVGGNGYMGIDLRPILAAAVNAIKELSAKNTALEARIAALEAA